MELGRTDTIFVPPRAVSVRDGCPRAIAVRRGLGLDLFHFCSNFSGTMLRPLSDRWCESKNMLCMRSANDRHELDNMQLCSINIQLSLGNTFPNAPQASSTFTHLVHLALDVADAMSKFSPFCPGRQYSRIIQNAASLVHVTRANERSGEEIDLGAMEDFMTILQDNGLDLPADFFDFPTESQDF